MVSNGITTTIGRPVGGAGGTPGEDSSAAVTASAASARETSAANR